MKGKKKKKKKSGVGSSKQEAPTRTELHVFVAHWAKHVIKACFVTYPCIASNGLYN